MFRVPFAKMQASGNDFILIDNRLNQVTGDVPEFVRKVCRPHFGIGADGLILINDSEAANFRWNFFNSDGGEVEMCGNGARCAAWFAFMRGLGGRKLSFETLAGIIHANVIKETNTVKVQLTKPTQFMPEITVNLPGGAYRASSINTGVPHVIYFMDDVESVDVRGLGSATRNHEMFRPAGTNVNFVKHEGGDRLVIRTYERGVEGETLACGTGATAAALVAGSKGLCSSPVTLTTRGGNELKVYFDWDGGFENVFLEGDAVLVFQGEIEQGAMA